MVLASRLARSHRRLALVAAAIAILAAGCSATAGRPPATGVSTSAASRPPVATAPARSRPVHLRIARPSEARPFVSPIGPDNRPNAVDGDTNGVMPARDLVWVAPHCRAARAAAPSLGLLLATAREVGVILHTDQCYRPLADQVAVRHRWSTSGNSACAAPVVTTSSGAPVGTSMHGWGKAADLSSRGGELTFGSPAYRFLTANAGRFGWNRPGWARPGGSACPEPWHWEWVGDGGTQQASPIRADVVTLLPTPNRLGYSIVTGLGAVHARGDAIDRGPRTGAPLASLVVAASRTPDGGGYWLAGADGSVHAFGDARSFGSANGKPLAQPIVGIAPSAEGRGYWLASADGEVFGFGAADSFGSPAASGRSLARPIVAIAVTPDGRGYWLAGAGGRVFAYGSAVFYGKASSRTLEAPIVSMTSTPDGLGYWLAGADGAVYAFGNARPFGSIPHRFALQGPVVAIAPTPDGGGYWLVAADGALFAFGDAGLYGTAHDGGRQG